MFFEEIFIHEYMRPGFSKSDLEDVVNAYDKVYHNVEDLKEYELKNSVLA
jgi:hypothetical protein